MYFLTRYVHTICPSQDLHLQSPCHGDTSLDPRQNQAPQKPPTLCSLLQRLSSSCLAVLQTRLLLLATQNDAAFQLHPN